MPPFFSIIIPTLNEEKYLPNLLSSLTEQKEKEFEVLVVDGYSEDKTVERAKDFAQKLPTLKILKSRFKNPAYQRNLGAKKAKGEYLVFFDADVTVERDFLKKVKENLVKKRYPLLTTWVETDERGFFSSLIKILVILMVELGRKIGKPFAPGFDIIIKRNIFFKTGGFNKRVNVVDDYDLILRAKKKGISLTVLRQPRLTFSLRRFRKLGRGRTLFEYLKMGVYFFFRGPVRKKRFSYPMGG